MLILTDSNASIDEIVAVLRETPIDGLKQIIGIRGEDVFVLWPRG